MNRWLLTSVTALALAVTSANAAASPANKSSAQPRVAFAEVLKVVDKTAGKVSALVSLKVNGRPMPVHITSALFVPMDELGNACGTNLKGATSGATAQFVSPHPGANALRVVTLLRSNGTFGGKYYTAKLTRTVLLGATGFECKLVANSPPPAQVCDFGTPPTNGNPDPNQFYCGVPVTGGPYWFSKPTVNSNGLAQAGHIASLSGYCWWDLSTAGHGQWFGSPVSLSRGWLCSNGYILEPYVYVYFAPPGSTFSSPSECEAMYPYPQHPGQIKAFTLPAGVGGIEYVEWKIIIRDNQGQSVGYEYSDKSAYPTGQLDGCSVAP